MNRQSWKNQTEILHSHCFRFPKSFSSHPPNIRLSSGSGGMQAAPSCASLHRGWLTGSRLEAAAKARNSLAGTTSQNTALIPQIRQTQVNGREMGTRWEKESRISQRIWGGWSGSSRDRGSCHGNGDAPAGPGRAKGRQSRRRGRQHPQPGWGREEEQAQRCSWERGRRNNKAGRGKM